MQTNTFKSTILYPSIQCYNLCVSDIVWLSDRGEESFYELISDDENVQDMMTQLSSVVQELDCVVDKHLFHFSYYNFLWKDDMHGNFKEFLTGDPGTLAIKREVERYS